MHKFTCPYCYGEHTINDCKLVCRRKNVVGFTKPDCKEGVSEDEKLYVLQKFNKKCYKCKKARRQIFCPTFVDGNIDAGNENDKDYVKKVAPYEIPREFIECGTSFSVALLGAKHSGKSNYMAILIHEIRKKMTAQFHCTLDICSSETSRKYYEENFATQLFKKKEAALTTAQDGIPPLVFPLRFLNQRNPKKKMVTLTFYDTAGGNLNSIENLGGYILNAKGIILLLDPLQLPKIREKLKGKTNLGEQNTDTVEILNRVIQYIRGVKNITGKIKIPIALVITKMDVLEKYGVLPADSCLREESEHLERGAFVLSDFENTDIETRRNLGNWLDEEIIEMLKNFETYAVFVLSALGQEPYGEQNRLSDAIHPKRVLDPLLWLLAKNKYIKIIRG